MRVLDEKSQNYNQVITIHPKSCPLDWQASTPKMKTCNGKKKHPEELCVILNQLYPQGLGFTEKMETLKSHSIKN